MGDESREEFRQWCLVEMMGHQKCAGLVSEVQLAGAAMLRIDIPEVEGGRPAWTRYISTSALYSLTPVTEELARAMAEIFGVVPLSPYEVSDLIRLVGPGQLDIPGRPTAEEQRKLAIDEPPTELLF